MVFLQKNILHAKVVIWPKRVTIRKWTKLWFNNEHLNIKWTVVPSILNCFPGQQSFCGQQTYSLYIILWIPNLQNYRATYHSDSWPPEHTKGNSNCMSLYSFDIHSICQYFVGYFIHVWKSFFSDETPGRLTESVQMKRLAVIAYIFTDWFTSNTNKWYLFV